MKYLLLQNRLCFDVPREELKRAPEQAGVLVTSLSEPPLTQITQLEVTAIKLAKLPGEKLEDTDPEYESIDPEVLAQYSSQEGFAGFYKTEAGFIVPSFDVPIDIKLPNKMSEKDLQKLMDDAWNKFPSSQDAGKRISYISSQPPFYGTEYRFDPKNQGSDPESAYTPRRPDNLDLTKVDCMTFIEHVLAMSLSKNVEEYKKIATAIRYYGFPSYINLNHFPEDWVERNERLNFFTEMTSNSNMATKMARSLYAPHLKNYKEYQEVKTEQFNYIPLAQMGLATTNGVIGDGDIIMFIRKEPTLQVGNDTYKLGIGHYAIAKFDEDTNTFFIMHARSQNAGRGDGSRVGKVECTQPLTAYTRTVSNTFIGFRVLKPGQ